MSPITPKNATPVTNANLIRYILTRMNNELRASASRTWKNTSDRGYFGVFFIMITRFQRSAFFLLIYYQYIQDVKQYDIA